VRIEGAINADRVDVPACCRDDRNAATELKSSDQSGVQKWSLDPFAQMHFESRRRIEVKACARGLE